MILRKKGPRKMTRARRRVEIKALALMIHAGRSISDGVRRLMESEYAQCMRRQHTEAGRSRYIEYVHYCESFSDNAEPRAMRKGLL